VYVHGNHEFYNANRSSVLDLTRRAQAENPNLVWLDSSSTELLGFNFLGHRCGSRAPPSMKDSSMR